MLVYAYLVWILLGLMQIPHTSAFRLVPRPGICRLRFTPPSMNIADRIVRVIKANINMILRRMEDPEKVIEQAVVEMQSDLIRIRKSYAEVAASLTRMQTRKEEDLQRAEDWYHRAERAVRSGDEGLAKEALSRRQLVLSAIESAQKALDAQKKAAQRLYSSLLALDSKLAEAKRQKESLIARARAAKTSINVNDLLSSLGDTTSAAALESMKERVDSLELQADVMEQLDPSIDGRFDDLEMSNKLEEELDRIRRQLPRPGVIDVVAALPSAEEAETKFEPRKRSSKRRS